MNRSDLKAIGKSSIKRVIKTERKRRQIMTDTKKAEVFNTF